MLGKRQEKYIEIVKKQFLNYFDNNGDILTEKFDEFVGKMLKELKPLWTTLNSSVHPSHLTRFMTNLKIKKVIAKLKEKESSKTQLSVTGHSEQEHSDIEDSSLHAIPSSTEGNIEEYAAGPCISHGALYSIAINYGHDSDESINYEELPLENIEDRLISQSFAMAYTSRISMGNEIDSAENEAYESIERRNFSSDILSAAVVNFDDDFTMNFESTHNMLAPPKPAVTQNPQQQIISLEEFPTEEQELQEVNNISAHDSDSSWMEFLSKKYNNAEVEMEQDKDSGDYDVNCHMDIMDNMLAPPKPAVTQNPQQQIISLEEFPTEEQELQEVNNISAHDSDSSWMEFLSKKYNNAEVEMEQDKDSGDYDVNCHMDIMDNMLAPPKPAVTQNPQQQIISLEEFPTEEQELQEVNNISAHDSDSSWMEFLSKKYNNAEVEMEQDKDSGDYDVNCHMDIMDNMLAPPKPAVTQNPQQQIISLEEFPTEEEELQELNNISAHDSDSSWMDFLSKKYNNAEKEMEQERNSCDYDVTCPMDISLSIDFGESFSMNDLGKTDEEIDDTVMSQISIENNQILLREASTFGHVSLDETIFDGD